MTKFAETDRDVANVEAWVDVIEEMLWCVPYITQEDIFRRVLVNVETERREEEERGTPYKDFTAEELRENVPLQTDQHRGAVARLTGLVVQILVRSLQNYHGPQTTAGVLFVEHPHGKGSRQLLSYWLRMKQ